MSVSHFGSIGNIPDANISPPHVGVGCATHPLAFVATETWRYRQEPKRTRQIGTPCRSRGLRRRPSTSSAGSSWAHHRRTQGRRGSVWLFPTDDGNRFGRKLLRETPMARRFPLHGRRGGNRAESPAESVWEHPSQYTAPRWRTPRASASRICGARETWNTVSNPASPRVPSQRRDDRVDGGSRPGDRPVDAFVRDDQRSGRRNTPAHCADLARETVAIRECDELVQGANDDPTHARRV